MAVVLDCKEAVAKIRNGDCVGIGGSVNAGHPMALIRALLRRRHSIRDLSVVGLTSGLEIDMLVATGMVTTLSAAYVGAEDIVGLPPATRWAAEEGTLNVQDTEEGIHIASLRARAQRQPYATWTGALGTSCSTHPLVEEARDEKTGMYYLKVRPQVVDYGLMWAEAADEHGNILMWGSDLGDEMLRNAADTRIVQVERILPTHLLARHPDRVVPWAADIIVREPLSTHPFTGTSIKVDELWLKEYANTVSRSRKEQNPEYLEGFFKTWVDEAEDEAAYLSQIGMRRLRELMV